MRTFLSYHEHQWWQTLFDDPKSLLHKAIPWYFDEFEPLLVTPSPVTRENTDSPLELALERERTGRQVYSGRRRTQAMRKTATPTKEKRNMSEDTGYMLAIESDELFVGKVTSIGISTISMILYTGTLTGCWEPLESAQGNQYVKDFLKKNLKDDMIFHLTGSGKLPAPMKTKLSKFLL